MSYTSRLKLTVDNFSPETDLIEVFSKKAGVVGVINPSQIASPPSGVSGAIQFSGGSAFASDAANLFWDNVNKRLGVGTSSPTELLTVGSSGKIGLLSPAFGQTTTIDVNGYQGLNILTGPNSTQGIIINGYGNAPNSLSATNSTNNTIRNYVITYRGGSGKGVLIDPISTSVGESTASLQVKGSGSTSATTSLLVQNSSGTQVLKSTDDGKLTIGTNSANSGALLFQYPSLANGVYWGDDYSTICGSITLSRGTGEMRIFANAGGYFQTFYTQGVERMRIDTNGNVGIGTTTPTQPLEVSSNATLTTLLISSKIGAGSGNSKTRLFFSQADSYTSYIEQGVGSLNIVTHGGSSPVNITGTLAVGSISGAKVGIKGDGSTSATKSLLVQNSASQTAFEVYDDKTSRFYNDMIIFPSAGGSIQFGVDINNNVRIIDTYAKFQIQRTGIGGAISLNGGGGAQCTYISNDNGHQFDFLGGYTQPDTFSINRQWFGNVVATTKNVLKITTSNSSTLFNAILMRGIYFAPTTTDWTEIRAFESTAGGAYFNTSSVNASAILQADSVTQGFLKPRMTTTQKNAIASPAAGLEVFDTTLGRPCFYSGSAWVTL